ncbi:hypothetical protein L798_04362 [Zootermopsis nevadensis]|uniref:Uncharacterized protein n=1 Tax=Zootermopsis nevadensis TaxID=136037 RepID=A0A067RWX9_ZOONE|nr:hypothetical protein L798_04362 [Zootermopsis nevadensis]
MFWDTSNTSGRRGMTHTSTWCHGSLLRSYQMQSDTSDVVQYNGVSAPVIRMRNCIMFQINIIRLNLRAAVDLSITILLGTPRTTLPTTAVLLFNIKFIVVLCVYEVTEVRRNVQGLSSVLRYPKTKAVRYS